jgi:two-component system OmpR family response regulator
MTVQMRIDGDRAYGSGLESVAMSQKILVIEDDRTTADFICKGLTGEGLLVDHVADGRDGLFHATDGSYDAIVLDRMLPGMDGMAILAAMRAAQIATPVIILSSLGAVDARVEGLTSGADDYLTKPFAFSELLARLKLLMARPSGGPNAETVLKCQDLEMNLLNRRVTRAGKRIDLQPREFRLLEYLLRHKDQVVTRTMMLEGVWEYHFDPGTNVVDVHVSRLRRKVDDGFGKPLVHTIRGAGYMLGNPD